MKKLFNLIVILEIFSGQTSFAQNSFPTPSGACILDATGTAAGKGGELRLSELNANGSNYISLKSPDAMSANTPYTFPNAYPTGSGKVLSSDGSGVLTWVKRTKTDLSNLEATTLINASLLPNANNTLNLGSSALGWANIYARGGYYVGFDKVIEISDASTSTFLGPTGNSVNTGYYNTFVGSLAGNLNTSGYNNTATGREALSHNTSGIDNTANGYQALSLNNATGSYNTADGGYALWKINDSYNTACGFEALYNTTASENNVAVGYQAGATYDYGYNNVFVGANTDAFGAGYYNDVAIGHATIATASSQARIGNSSTGSIGGYADWTNISDGRYKKNVKEDVKGLEFILKLRPVTYNLDVTGISEHLNESRGHEMIPQMKTAMAEKEKTIQSGFIAQEVEAAAKEVGYDFSGVDAPKNENDLYGLRYAEFVVPLVKAVQELSKQNEDLKKEVEELKSSIVNHESSMSDGFAKLSTDNGQPATPLLGQNIPNPFDNSTLIPFRIPKDCKDASIMITNTSTSEVISVIPISCNEDHVSIDAGTLASGTYSYSLYVDGKMIESKQMVLSK